MTSQDYEGKITTLSELADMGKREGLNDSQEKQLQQLRRQLIIATDMKKGVEPALEGLRQFYNSLDTIRNGDNVLSVEDALESDKRRIGEALDFYMPEKDERQPGGSRFWLPGK